MHIYRHFRGLKRERKLFLETLGKYHYYHWGRVFFQFLIRERFSAKRLIGEVTREDVTGERG